MLDEREDTRCSVVSRVIMGGPVCRVGCRVIREDTRKGSMYIDTASNDGGGPERLGRKDTH